MRKAAFSVLATIFLAACGGDDGGGGPTTPSTSLTSLSLSPATDLIKIKANETFTANGSFSDGSTRAVEATWGSDTAAVATVSAGRVTGVGPGQATIFADFQGMRATRLLRVVPDYHGRWNGDHVQTGCADDGFWEGACASEFENGDVFIMTLALTQTRDTISGTADFGESGQVRGTIRVSGHLGLEGTQVATQDGLTLEAALSNWETLTTDNERMTGRFTLTFRALGFPGSLRLDTDLRIVSKTSTTPLTATPRIGRDQVWARLSAALRAARARKGG